MNDNIAAYRPFTTKCPWDIIDVIKALALYFFLVSLGIPALFYGANYVAGKDFMQNVGENNVIIILSVFVNSLTSLYIIYMVCVEYKQPLISIGLTLVNWRKNVAEGIKKYVIALPFFALAGFLTDYVSKQFGAMPQQQEIAKRVLHEQSVEALVFMVVFGVVIAPVIEELLFRGFLQTALNRYLGKWGAILLSSCFFAIVHMNIYVFLQIFLLGILLAYVFQKTGSLISTMTIHAIHNGSTFALLLMFRKVF